MPPSLQQPPEPEGQLTEGTVVVFMLALAVGYIVYSCTAGGQVGEEPKFGSSVRFLTGNSGEYLHLHHWLIHGVLLIALMAYLFLFHSKGDLHVGVVILLGFLLGGMLQGLSYADWRQIKHCLTPDMMKVNNNNNDTPITNSSA